MTKSFLLSGILLSFFAFNNAFSSLSEQGKHELLNEETTNISEQNLQEEFHFTKENFYKTIWKDFNKELLSCLSESTQKDGRISINESYEKYSQLIFYISSTFQNFINGLNNKYKNKFLSAKKDNIPFNLLLNSVKRNFLETNDLSGEIINASENNFEGEMFFTLKKISGNKKFQLHLIFECERKKNEWTTKLIEIILE